MENEFHTELWTGLEPTSLLTVVPPPPPPPLSLSFSLSLFLSHSPSLSLSLSLSRSLAVSAEVLVIMCRDCPSSEPLPFYTTFANHIWNVFQCVCRDLGELRYLVQCTCSNSVERHHVLRSFPTVRITFAGTLSIVCVCVIFTVMY